MRLVLDTSVLVAALRSRKGSSRLLLVDALRQQVEIVLSVPLALEYEAVLTRPEHLRAFGLSRDEVERLLDALFGVARAVDLAFTWRPVSADPNDDMVIETAVNGGADMVVTFNAKDFAGLEARFGIPAASPAQYLLRFGERS
ncbi:MAG: putative toxin-antitoxin system toxin component, PIN family [Mesorhizobium sp.]|nr:putative toxin-antitoxin system toxin component, PIN family [Mesorhizobium sp.]MCO5162776.1 putative toxin-antitoxin system toxin component, PIN family [Mesorhizobium sp.]